jgi:hypothetical protein
MRVVFVVGLGLSGAEAFAGQRLPRSSLHASAPARSSPLTMGDANALVNRRAALASALFGAATVLAPASPALAADARGVWSYSDFLEGIENDKVDVVTFSDDGRRLAATDVDGVVRAVNILGDKVRRPRRRRRRRALRRGLAR